MNNAEMERSKVEVGGQADAEAGTSRRMAYQAQGIVARDTGEAVEVRLGLGPDDDRKEPPTA